MTIKKLRSVEYEGMDVVLDGDKMVLVQIGTSFFNLVPHFLNLSSDETITIISSDLYSLELLKED